MFLTVGFESDAIDLCSEPRLVPFELFLLVFKICCQIGKLCLQLGIDLISLHGLLLHRLCDVLDSLHSLLQD